LVLCLLSKGKFELFVKHGSISDLKMLNADGKHEPEFLQRLQADLKGKHLYDLDLIKDRTSFLHSDEPGRAMLSKLKQMFPNPPGFCVTELKGKEPFKQV
jgi:hypothetical protein